MPFFYTPVVNWLIAGSCLSVIILEIRSGGPRTSLVSENRTNAHARRITCRTCKLGYSDSLHACTCRSLKSNTRLPTPSSMAAMSDGRQRWRCCVVPRIHFPLPLPPHEHLNAIFRWWHLPLRRRSRPFNDHRALFGIQNSHRTWVSTQRIFACNGIFPRMISRVIMMCREKLCLYYLMIGVKE